MTAVSPPRRPARVLLLAPSLEGRDGISRVGRSIRAVLAGGPRPVPCEERVLAGGAGRAARGSRVRFALGGALESLRDPASLLVLATHLHLLPVGLPAHHRGARLAAFLHGIECWTTLRGLRRRALAACDLLLANSRWTLDRFREFNPSLAGVPAAVCALGIPGEGAAAEGPPEEGPFALTVGRMLAAERYKGHDLLLDLWPRLLRAHPAMRLIVAGGGDDRARLEERARPLGDRVSFAGEVSDGALAGLLRDCAFLALPSRNEGFGLVYLEAMRSGKACLAGRGAPEEVVLDGTTGLVADPADPGAVLEALAALAGDRERREAMGRAGRMRFLETFTEEAFGERLRAALDGAGLLPGGGDRGP